jgi:hypothetical protein
MMRRLATSGRAVFSVRARGSTGTVLIRLAVAAAAASCLLYRERTKARAVARYSNNPEHRANPEYRERRKALARARYANDPEYRAREKARSLVNSRAVRAART